MTYHVLREDPHDACAAIVHYLATETDLHKRTLLMEDLHAKSRSLEEGSRQRFSDAALATFAAEPKRQAALVPMVGTSEQQPVDVLVMAVVEIERRALLAAFDIDADDPDLFTTESGRRIYATQIHSRHAGRALDVTLTSLTEPLNVRSAATITQLKSRFSAGAYFVIGMAAGLRDKTTVGDVVVPELVHYYEPGRQEPETFEPRREVEHVNRVLYRNLSYYEPGDRYFARVDELLAVADASRLPDDLPVPFRPKYHGRNVVLVSGEQLIQDGRLTREQVRIDERIKAGDQEAYGAAIGLQDATWALFRGIADYGEHPKPNRYQYVATTAAAVALREFLETEYEPLDAAEF